MFGGCPPLPESGHRSEFEDAYPGLELPIIYGEIDDIPKVAVRYDAVVATFNPSVAWIAPAAKKKPDQIVGYYAQDFEPMFYPPGSEGYQQAWDSYTLIPNMVLFAKTEWTRKKIETETNASCQLVGPSMDVDLFVPRPHSVEWPDRPLRVGAMIRPASLYRAPKLTMEVLERISRQYGPRVEILLFGTEKDDPNFAQLSQNFPWNLAGILGPNKVANFLNELDIFVDFSSHQAMGLTAMEAMACGVAVIVPREGGTSTFSQHEKNCLMVDTSNQNDCLQSLKMLIDDHNLRAKLQKQAIQDMPQYFPERAALKILSCLFNESLV
ncbi:MAG: glycosyltransferase family 4 protein, partial [Anaerolineales bacterium]